MAQPLTILSLRRIPLAEIARSGILGYELPTAQRNYLETRITLDNLYRDGLLNDDLLRLRGGLDLLSLALSHRWLYLYIWAELDRPGPEEIEEEILYTQYLPLTEMGISAYARVDGLTLEEARSRILEATRRFLIKLERILSSQGRLWATQHYRFAINTEGDRDWKTLFDDGNEVMIQVMPFLEDFLALLVYGPSGSLVLPKFREISSCPEPQEEPQDFPIPEDNLWFELSHGFIVPNFNAKLASFNLDRYTRLTVIGDYLYLIRLNEITCLTRNMALPLLTSLTREDRRLERIVLLV